MVRRNRRAKIPIFLHVIFLPYVCLKRITQEHCQQEYLSNRARSLACLIRSSRLLGSFAGASADTDGQGTDLLPAVRPPPPELLQAKSAGPREQALLEGYYGRGGNREDDVRPIT